MSFTMPRPKIKAISMWSTFIPFDPIHSIISVQYRFCRKCLLVMHHLFISIHRYISTLLNRCYTAHLCQMCAMRSSCANRFFTTDACYTITPYSKRLDTSWIKMSRRYEEKVRQTIFTFIIWFVSSTLRAYLRRHSRINSVYYVVCKEW